MFDKNKVPDAAPAPTRAVDIKGLSVEELLDLRAKVQAALPATSLAGMNLETEVVVQFLQVKTLLGKLLSDDGTPANQKAQVANSCQSILDQLMKMQNALYGTERVKAMEQALVKALRTLPEDARRVFLAEYTRIYRAGASVA